jgi:hypothetical protein
LVPPSLPDRQSCDRTGIFLSIFCHNHVLVSLFFGADGAHNQNLLQPVPIGIADNLWIVSTVLLTGKPLP